MCNPSISGFRTRGFGQALLLAHPHFLGDTMRNLLLRLAVIYQQVRFYVRELLSDASNMAEKKRRAGC
jgi:hypothetical protein